MDLQVKKVVLATLLMLMWLNVFAQKTITGMVTDINHEPLIGATVTIKGAHSNGVITDVNGNYSITVSSGDPTLVFSFVGFVSQDMTTKGESHINVILNEDKNDLNEVVVIGYGTVKRKDLTGAVASVKGDKLEAVPVSNVAEALQGKLPGVNVTSQDGRPGATVNIRVRGGGSITQSNDPLFVVDGFPVSSISDIPASEIESIDVLKDASSTAIYGARGANGVILITTKNPISGKVKINYDAYVQLKTVAKTMETLSTQEYVLYNWSYAKSRGTANGDAVAKYFGLGSSYGNHYADYANMSTHNYTDDLLRTAFSHNHSVSISGGTDKTKVLVDFNYLNDEGIKTNSDLHKFTSSIKIQQKLTKNLTFDFDLRYNESTQNGRESITNGQGSTISSAYTYKPIDNPLGGVSYSDVASGFSFGIANIDDDHNPVKLTNDIKNKNSARYLRGSASLSWVIIQGLTERSELSLSRSSSKDTYYENGYTNGEKRATLTRGTGNGVRWVNSLNYKFNINKDNVFDILAGNELLKTESESTSLTGRGYPENFDYDTTMGLIHTATETFSASNTIGVPNKTVSYFGRVNYNLFERYLFTATFRADGSSKFAPDNRWGYFPAAALGWRISEEQFMQGAKEWLSNLKFRISIGSSGSDNINSNLWRETWSTTSSSSNHVLINGENTPFYKPDGLLANNSLKWETTISRNIGIDYGFMNGRINGSLELYWNTTKDLLMAVPVDNTTGYSYQYQNFGQTSNKGLELSVNMDVIKTNDFTFNIGAIYNYNRNRLDKLDNADQYLYSSYWDSSATRPTNDYMFVKGKAIGIVRGFVSDGFYTVDDFTYENGKYVLKKGVADFAKAIGGTYMSPFKLPDGQCAFPGAVKFKDLDGSGTVTLDDVADLGEMIARHTGSFQLNFRYKDFDLSSNFNWTIGGKIYNVAAMINASGHEYNGIGEQRAKWVNKSFKMYNVDSAGELYAVTDPVELATLNANAKYGVTFHQTGITSSEWIENGSYLRMQTITIGYTVPQKAIKHLGLERIRLYLTGTNLFTITGYSGLDPEVSTKATGQAGFLSSLSVFPTPNMDFGSYPRARTFTLGANISF